jgi:hypothetical protein
MEKDVKEADVKFTSDLDTGEEEVSEPSDDETEEEEETKEVESSEEEGKEKEKVVPREHYENLLKALQETRGKSRADMESMKRRLLQAEKKLDDVQKAKEKEIDIFEGAEDEDVMTIAGAKKQHEAIMKKLAEREAGYNEMMGAMLVGMSEFIFKKDHPDYDEITAPYKDLVENDPDFVKKILADGIESAPLKLYEYAKKQSGETETDKTKKKTGQVPIDKPKTMDKKSKSESSRVDPDKLTLAEKRKLKPEELDESWMKLVK